MKDTVGIIVLRLSARNDPVLERIRLPRDWQTEQARDQTSHFHDWIVPSARTKLDDCGDERREMTERCRVFVFGEQSYHCNHLDFF